MGSNIAAYHTGKSSGAALLPLAVAAAAAGEFCPLGIEMDRARKTGFPNALGHKMSKASGTRAETESWPTNFSRFCPALMSKIMRMAV